MAKNFQFTKESYEKELKKDIKYLSDNFDSEIDQFDINNWLEICKNNPTFFNYSKASTLAISCSVASSLATSAALKRQLSRLIPTLSTEVALQKKYKNQKTPIDIKIQKIIKDPRDISIDRKFRQRQTYAMDNFLETVQDERNYFYNKIVYYCNLKDLDEVEVYKKAGLTRSIFSKIRSMDKTGYIPSKSTVISICLALELSLSETQEMLEIVGLRLSNKLIIDKIISWCIVHRKFIIMDIDEIIYDKIGEPYFCKV